MSLLFELCQSIQGVLIITTWMALSGVLTTHCMPGAQGQRAQMEKGKWKREQDGAFMGSIL